MTFLGVDPVRLLPYRDSGMAGTDGNNDPRSLVQANHDALLADVVFQIRDLRPHAVVTFGPDGVYGHPDHVRIGAVTTEAVETAALATWPFLGSPWQVARLFHVAVAREDLRVAKARGVGFWSTLSDEAIESMGVPTEQVTHVFDVRPYAEEKLLAIQMHATQIPFQPEPGSPGDPAMRPRLGKESLTRIPLPWDGDDRDFLDDLHTDEAIPL
jgi:N-acetyl-1-D-myo-inositol-2-amino-2-deoxy-alpha-D-glucopyranoside deacetylase